MGLGCTTTRPAQYGWYLWGDDYEISIPPELNFGKGYLIETALGITGPFFFLGGEMNDARAYMYSNTVIEATNTY